MDKNDGVAANVVECTDRAINQLVAVTWRHQQAPTCANNAAIAASVSSPHTSHPSTTCDSSSAATQLTTRSTLSPSLGTANRMSLLQNASSRSRRSWTRTSRTPRASRPRMNWTGSSGPSPVPLSRRASTGSRTSYLVSSGSFRLPRSSRPKACPSRGARHTPHQPRPGHQGSR